MEVALETVEGLTGQRGVHRKVTLTVSVFKKGMEQTLEITLKPWCSREREERELLETS